MDQNHKRTFITVLVVSVVISAVCGGVMGFFAASLGSNSQAAIKDVLGRVTGKNSADIILPGQEKVVTVNEESAIITAVEKVSPAVVSIIVTKDLPIIERYYSSPVPGSDFFQQFFGDDFNDFMVPQYRQKGTQKQEVGGGTGFIISPDGYIVTNKHVVSDQEAEYTVLMNDETKHPAKVLARDPVSDLAILKIDGKNYISAELGDSSSLKPGQTVIAIGNALGEFRNTVSTGVVSGLSRSVIAGTGQGSEQLSGVIQTDASINVGNSGGPLLNIAGQVIGINTAIAQGAQNIGFTIPINEVKNSIESVQKTGKISRPWLGVRYVLVDKAVADQNKLSVDYGALLVKGETATDLAVIPGSPADKAGLAENDIILEVDGVKINQENTLAALIGKHKTGDQVTLKILHDGKSKDVNVKLEEMK